MKPLLPSSGLMAILEVLKENQFQLKVLGCMSHSIILELRRAHVQLHFSVNYLELDHQIFAALLLTDFLIHNFDLSCQVLAINFFFYLSNFSTSATLSPILQAITVLLKIGSLRLKWLSLT